MVCCACDLLRRTTTTLVLTTQGNEIMSSAGAFTEDDVAQFCATTGKDAGFARRTLAFFDGDLNEGNCRGRCAAVAAVPNHALTSLSWPLQLYVQCCQALWMMHRLLQLEAAHRAAIPSAHRRQLLPRCHQ